MRDVIGTLLKTETSRHCYRRSVLQGSPQGTRRIDCRYDPHGLRDSDSFKDVLRRFCILAMLFWAKEETSRIAAEFGAV